MEECPACSTTTVAYASRPQGSLHDAASTVSQPAAEGGSEHVWDDIYRSASGLALREPVLFRRLRDIVIERTCPSDVLAALLARKLACTDLAEVDLYTLILALLRDSKNLIHQTTADIAAVALRDPACPDHLHVLLNLKGFQALQAYRVCHCLWQQRRPELALALANQAALIFGIDIHPAARIGSGVMLDHGAGIVIGETAVVDDNVSILQGVTLGGTGKESGDRHPKIRSGVMIGANATILGNIEIGAMSRVAAGSVVLANVPPCSTVAGVPAKIVRQHHGVNFPALDMRQTL